MTCATVVKDVLNDVHLKSRVLALHIHLHVSSYASQLMYSQYSFLLDHKTPAESGKD